MLGLVACVLAVGEPTIHNLSFSGPRDWTYDARLVVPSGERSGLVVLMIGGGLGNDLGWTVPATLEWNGEVIPMTIDGTTHHDAPRIAGALAAHGHAVMHYSTIAREDPKRDRWPYEMTMMAPTELLSLATLAATCVRAHPATTKDRLVLLGHSMGGQRSCAQAADDPAVVGLVLLAPAQMTRTGPDDPGGDLNQLEAHAQLKAQDTNGDGQVQGAEIPESSDLDKDGTLRLWEASAILARVRRAAMPPQDGPDSHGIPFGEDALAKRPLPTLVLYGSLDDAQSHHAPILQDLIDAGTLTSVEVRILPGIGHQLGPEQDNRLGPVSNEAIELITAFLQRHRRQAPPPQGQ